MENTTVRFFKLDESWYADVQGHTLEDNQMVAGADEFLQTVDTVLGGKGEVNITVSDKVDVSEESRPFLAKLGRVEHDEAGATYVLSGPLAEQYNAVGFRLWICNVTHDVLGEHPQCIYIFDMK